MPVSGKSPAYLKLLLIDVNKKVIKCVKKCLENRTRLMTNRADNINPSDRPEHHFSA